MIAFAFPRAWSHGRQYSRSYPKSKKPIVATVDTVRDSGLPDIPAKEGAMMAGNQDKEPLELRQIETSDCVFPV